MRAFYIHTLGCKVNQYESQAMREAWLLNSWQEKDEAAGVDLILINSCAVTQKAITDLCSTVRRLNRESPKADIILTGCAAQTFGDKLWSLPGVFILLERNAKPLVQHIDDAVLEILYSMNPAKRRVKGQLYEALLMAGKDLGAGNTFVSDYEDINNYAAKDPKIKVKTLADPDFPDFFIRDYKRSRAVLKIQDGCSHCCTYCIVPLARGVTRSRPAAASLAEAERLLKAGFSEIVISGINLRQYEHFFVDGAASELSESANLAAGKSEKSEKSEKLGDFWDFISFLEEKLGPLWAGKARFRISSLEPSQLNAKGLEVLSKSKIIAEQLHLSLQSGSPSVLKLMGRDHYKSEDIICWLRELNKVWPVMGLGADFISGFPGETEKDHRQTMELMQALPLTYAHVFPYSSRPGTRASKLGEQVTGKIKKQRAAELRALGEEKKEIFMQSMASRKDLLVAVEKNLNSRGRLHGLSQCYVDCEFVDDPEKLKAKRQQIEAKGADSGFSFALIPAEALELKKDFLLVRSFF